MRKKRIAMSSQTLPLHYIPHSRAYEDLSCIMRDAHILEDRKIKDAILKNEAIVNNLRMVGLDVYDMIDKAPTFFNIQVHHKLLELNDDFRVCHHQDIATNMKNIQWILNFLVRYNTAQTESKICAVSANQL